MAEWHRLEYRRPDHGPLLYLALFRPGFPRPTPKRRIDGQYEIWVDDTLIVGAGNGSDEDQG